MKYASETEINLPVEKVLELFDSVENLKHWQPGFLSFEHISGTPGEVGAKSKLKYKSGGRVIEMVETITKKNLPHEFNGTYEAKGVYNTIENKFTRISSAKTKWSFSCEFIFNSLLMKLFAFLFSGMFKKQSVKTLHNFKNFAENGTSIVK